MLAEANFLLITFRSAGAFVLVRPGSINIRLLLSWRSVGRPRASVA